MMQFLKHSNQLLSPKMNFKIKIRIYSHDAKHPRGFQHGARFVDVQRGPRSADGPAEPAGVVVLAASPVGAVGVGHGAQHVDGTDEGADEEEIDKGDEAGRVFGAAVEEQRADGPGDRQRGYYEQDQDLGGSAVSLAVVDVDEPGLLSVSFVRCMCRLRLGDCLPACPWSG